MRSAGWAFVKLRRPALAAWGWVRRLAQPTETGWMVIAAILVGLGTGAGVWLFKGAFALIHRALFDGLGGWLAPLGGWTIASVSALGGLLVGLISFAFLKEERHSGVAGIMEAVALAGGRLRYRRMPLKVFLSALSIGSGASVGPEDPSVQVGANLGAMLGQWLRLSDERVRALVAAGSAGGIAAAFNAPIAGVFFALEIILGEISGGALGVVVLAAVAAAAVIQALSGAQPAFPVPPYALNSLWELPLYLGLGILAGPVAAAYVRLIYFFRDGFARLPLPRWARPAFTGLILGVAGLFLPQLLGTGYDAIELTLNGSRLTLLFLLALLLGKLALTPISLGGGFTGGMFAPSLFLGAMLGAGFAGAARALLPGLTLATPAFAMVGMAAVLAGAVHAPLTAILLLFEMTNDYRIILPLMITVITAMLVAQRLERESVYTLALLRKGIRLERGRDVELLERIHVSEVMHTDPATLRADAPLSQAAELLFQTRHHGAMVVDAAGRLVGVLALQDLDRAGPESWPLTTAGSACTRSPLVTYPDETLGEALRRMGTADVGRLPVVARDDPTRLLGALSRPDVVRAYSLALTRRAAVRHRMHEVRLDAFSDVGVQEVTIEAGSPCAGQRLHAVAWPAESLVASLRRGQQVIIPHGDTLLLGGDVLIVMAGVEAMPEVRRLCRAAPVAPEGEGSPGGPPG